MKAQNIRLLVGLGNPGSQYELTRHNAGVWLLKQLADHNNLTFKQESKFNGSVTRLRKDGSDCWLLIPSTYMNLSGDAVQAFASYHKIKPEEILIAHDELDFGPGTTKLKIGGGHGGHNGLRDIVSKLGSNSFLRLRIGIGHPGNSKDVTPFVLSRPSISEKQSIQDSLDTCEALIFNIFDPEKREEAMKALHTDSKGF